MALARGQERERLRSKGQFWTPDWIAKAMVTYALMDGATILFDPAVGAGAFFRAARELKGQAVRLSGNEIDRNALQQAREKGLIDGDLEHVRLTDFLETPADMLFPAVVANPPYVRHHRLESELKRKMQAWTGKLLGRSIDGRAGLHVYFLLKILTHLAPGGRAALILPADVCEGVFASGLWSWITRGYRLEAAVTFKAEATPFVGVDTNPIVLLIRNAHPTDLIRWAYCTSSMTNCLSRWVSSGFVETCEGLEVCERQLSEALSTGLTRPPASFSHDHLVLKDVARVMRGIATGETNFFLLTEERARHLAIPKEFLQRAVARVRDVQTDVLDNLAMEKLRASGRPTLLFSPDGRALEQFPNTVREYLAVGQTKGLPQKPLISTRRPWYKMESRTVPPILFAYLGRRNQRFILNTAEVLPLTGFLAVYPRTLGQDYARRLWQALNHPDTIANLPLVSKSYGGGALKAEPRQLENLPIPQHVAEQFNLAAKYVTRQPQLLSL